MDFGVYGPTLAHHLPWIFDRGPTMPDTPFARALHGAWIALLFLSLPSVGWAQATPDSIPPEVTPERMKEGYDLFQNGSCRNCHGDMGRGGTIGGPSLRDIEWLHSTGDFDGIFQTIFWGVRPSEVKAQTRPWEMHPKGSLTIDREQVQTIAAYIWGQHNGLFEPSAEDLYIDYVAVRTVDEARSRYLALREQTGEIPFQEARLGGLARDVADAGDFDRAVELFELVIEAYPESAVSYYRLAQIAARRGETTEAIGYARTALEIDPELQGAANLLTQLGGGVD